MHLPVEGQRTLSCECAGKKITIQNLAPVDGLTISKCFGFIKKTICTEIAKDESSIPYHD
jgi:hypothetical protein